MDLALKIKTAREKLDLSQRDLARDLKVSAAAVGQWENGTNRPKLSNRVDLSKRLRIPFRDLLPETENTQQILVSDPEALILLERFLLLPAPVREAFLMQVVSVADSLGILPVDSSDRKQVPSKAGKPG